MGEVDGDSGVSGDEGGERRPQDVKDLRLPSLAERGEHALTHFLSGLGVALVCGVVDKLTLIGALYVKKDLFLSYTWTITSWARRMSGLSPSCWGEIETGR